MRTLHTIKNHLLENKQHSGRMVWTFVAILLSFGILISRQVYLQVYHHNKYVSMSQNNRAGIIPIAPKRGLIFDRNGVILAKNKPSFSLARATVAPYINLISPSLKAR